MTTIALPATKSFRVREAEYTPVRPGLGVLEIRESVAPGRSVHQSRYAVREEPATDGFRTFVLTKSGGESVHHVTILPHRRTTIEDRCDCDGATAGYWCRHLCALRVLIDSDHLPRIPKPETPPCPPS